VAAGPGSADRKPPLSPVPGASAETRPGPAEGQRQNVPGDNHCLLHAFAASDPERVRDTLHTWGRIDNDAYRWLSNARRVRTDLARNTALHAAHGIFLRGTHSDVARDTAEHVAQWLEANAAQLPGEFARQYRGNDDSQVFAGALERLDDGQLLALVLEHNLLPPAEARALGRQALFTELWTGMPLQADELAGLAAAVRTWDRSWQSAEGDMFIMLLAYAFDVRFHIVQGGDASEVGPPGATRRVELFRTGVDSGHFSGSDAPPRDIPPRDIPPLGVPDAPQVPDDPHAGNDPEPSGTPATRTAEELKWHTAVNPR